MQRFIGDEVQDAAVVVVLGCQQGHKSAGAGPPAVSSNRGYGFFLPPGLKIVSPSNPVDAKGLLNAAIEDPNPVLFLSISIYTEV